MRLHHRVGLVGRGVGRIELHRRRGKRRRKIADGRIGVAGGRGRTTPRRREVEASLGRGVLDADELGGGPRLLQGLGNDQRDRLVIVLDLGAAQQLRGVVLALAELAGILRRHDGEHAGGGPGSGEVD